MEKTKTEKQASHKLETLPGNGQFHIGRGVFTWLKFERVSDRYGSCYVMNEGGNSRNDTGSAVMWFPPEGQRGSLIAVVIEAKQSTHIGDFFAGHFPQTPNVGDIILLGHGAAFKEDSIPNCLSVGVTPDDGRESNWLNPKALYNVHESKVDLLWVPD